jgi:hypothetical protein
MASSCMGTGYGIWAWKAELFHAEQFGISVRVRVCGPGKRVLRNSLETHWRAVSFFVSFALKADYFTMDISGNSTPG